MTIYVVQATATKGITVQIPTFYLNKDTQGIVSKKHAEQIARHIIDPFRVMESVSVSVSEWFGEK